MNPYGPYREGVLFDKYEMARLMREKYDMEPSLHAQELGRLVADLQD